MRVYTSANQTWKLDSNVINVYVNTQISELVNCPCVYTNKYMQANVLDVYDDSQNEHMKATYICKAKIEADTLCMYMLSPKVHAHAPVNQIHEPARSCKSLIYR